MNPRDFYILAIQLSNGLTAAERRSAVSRSYYATFNTAAELLRQMGFPIGKGAAAHGEVQHCLANAGEPILSEVAASLGSLHTVRNQADYQLDRGDVKRPANAQAAALKAGLLIQKLDASFQGPTRGHIESSIRIWRKMNGYP
jgi:hypothetical protein